MLKDEYHGNTLQAASFRGYGKVVRMLIDAGADVNTQGGIHGNALHVASLRGYDEVEQMNVQDRGYDNTL